MARKGQFVKGRKPKRNHIWFKTRVRPKGKSHLHYVEEKLDDITLKRY